MPYHLIHRFSEEQFRPVVELFNVRTQALPITCPYTCVAGRFEEASMMSDDRTESSWLTVLPLLDWARWRQYGIDYIIEVASQSTLGNPVNCNNTEWYVDGVHLTTAGLALLAPIYLVGIDALIAQL